MSKKVNRAILVSVMTVFAMNSLAQAASTVLNVTLGQSYDTGNDYSGAGVLPSGQYWNLVNTYDHGSVGNNSQGPTTSNPFYLLYDDGSTQSTIAVSGSTTSPGFLTNSINPLLRDALTDASRFAATASFTISGVAPNALGYDLVLYSYDGGVSFGTFVPPDTTYFTLNGVTKTADSTADATSSTGGFTEGVNYAEYSGIQPVGGNISFTFDYQTAFHAGPTTDGSPEEPDLLAMFNGFQLAPIPEPTSLGLLMLGGTVLLRRRRINNA